MIKLNHDYEEGQVVPVLEMNGSAYRVLWDETLPNKEPAPYLVWAPAENYYNEDDWGEVEDLTDMKIYEIMQLNYALHWIYRCEIIITPDNLYKDRGTVRLKRTQPGIGD